MNRIRVESVIFAMIEIIEKTDVLAVVALRGRLDSAAAQELETPLEDLVRAGHRFVVLDFNEVTLLASDGLKLLLRLEASCRKCDGALALAAVPAGVLVVLELAGFAPHFRRYADVTAARAALVG